MINVIEPFVLTTILKRGVIRNLALSTNVHEMLLEGLSTVHQCKRDEKRRDV